MADSGHAGAENGVCAACRCCRGPGGHSLWPVAQNRSDDTAAPSSGAAPARVRIDGIDAARALAVFGMFVVHLGVDSMGVLSPDDYAWDLHDITRGNSSALFAFLAGISLAMMTGRTRPVAGDELRRSTVRILARSVLIGLLGLLLDMTGVPVAVILAYYAGFFVLALPLLRLRSGALWAVAGVLAVLGPPLSLLLRGTVFPAEPRTSSLTSLTEFFLTGYYPAVTFMAFMAAGMAVGRLDLTSTAVRLRLLAAGAGAAAFGYAGSWLVLGPLGGTERLMDLRSRETLGVPLARIEDPALVEELRFAVNDEAHSISGQVPTDSWWWLGINAPHTGTTFEIAEAVGQSLMVLVVCIWLCERFRRTMYPLTSVGRMPLTVYAGHILVLAVVIAFQGYDYHTPWLLEGFLLGSLVFAVLWRATVGRGPAESVLGEAAGAAVTLVEERRRRNG